MNHSDSSAFTSILACRRESLAKAISRAHTETAPSSDQCGPWQAVVMDDGSTEVRAPFKRGKSVRWFTLVNLPFTTGNHKDSHSGVENAARIANAMNSRYGGHMCKKD